MNGELLSNTRRFFFRDKAIQIKCFVSHRPLSRESGSVGRVKAKKSETEKERKENRETSVRLVAGSVSLKGQKPRRLGGSYTEQFRFLVLTRLFEQITIHVTKEAVVLFLEQETFCRKLGHE